MKAKIQSKNGHKVIQISRRKAIRERCLNCSSWSRKEVESCPYLDCPLYPYRRAKGKQNAKARYKAIRQYCLWCCGYKKYEVARCPALDCPLYAYRKGGLDRTLENLFLSEKRPNRSRFEKELIEKV